MKRMTNLAVSIRRAVAMPIGVLVLFAAPACGLAAIVCEAPALSVPPDIDGVHLDLVTGATSTNPILGWDINLYGTSTSLYFFWPQSPPDSSGGVATGGVYNALSAGQEIGPSQTYIRSSGGGGSAPYINWQTAQTGKYLGLRLFNETTSAINYGWLQLDSGANNGFPATINEYCYDDAGAAIKAGDRGPSMNDYCGSSAIPVPANIDGVYLNLIAGTTSTSESFGWDVNLYGDGPSRLYFYWPNNPINTAGGVATGSVYDALSAGQEIGPAQTYIRSSGGGGPAPYINWQTAQTGKYLGLRLYNEITSTINYGWLQLDSGGANGLPATINRYCVRPTGEAIRAGEARLDAIFHHGFDR